MPLHIELACNDWRNGVHQGNADAVKLFGCDLTGRSVATDWKNERLKRANSAAGDLTLRVGRLVVPCLAYTTWCGNWCWDSATVRLVFLVQIWNYLQKRDWHCEGGPCELYDLFNAHTPMEPRSAPDLLRRILQPSREPAR